MLAVVATSFNCVNAQEKKVDDLKSWEFSRDSINWEPVCIPHDWAIAGPFDKKWDLQRVAIVQNGETDATEKSGRSGALPWIGKGYYRTTVTLETLPQHAELLFDGAMSEPVVYINGKEAGRWAYGYNAFRVDCNPYLIEGENVINVCLKNVEESSRWYPGGGLYRPVKIITSPKIHFDMWGSYVRTVAADHHRAGIAISSKVVGMAPGSEKDLHVSAVLFDAEGKEVARKEDIRPNVDGDVSSSLIVSAPHLWSPETPYLYTLRLKLETPGGTDEQVLKVGIRTLSYSAERGFELNGKSRKFKGVCLHHDLGPLGAAVNRAALERQIRILKDMGCDAIRTSHNMPSTMQMEVCDSMGMMVMAESFDMWLYPKCKNGYARFFSDWADRDIENMVLNHRNHPSIVMWSVGNEIPEQWSAEGREISRRLQDICHRLDPSRPVTQGMDRAEDALNSGFAQVMDIPGFNYRVHKYDNNIKQLPQGFLLGCETASTISSRGVYKFPVVLTDHTDYPDGQCSSYDTEWCSWSNLPDEDFYMMDDRAWTIGQFVWTGFDYLGEPTPYDEYWPSRSSYFGICDLAGLPKDRYYLYRSQWNTSAHTIHLLPHWTWPGREGQVTPVYCYTDYPEAELFVNGVSQGRVRKLDRTDAGELSKKLLDRYRIRWNDVVYEPGELKVVVFDDKGEKAGEQVVHTAGKAATLKMSADRQMLRADGEDLVYVTISLEDKNGIEIPDATDLIAVSVSGAGTFRGICNGDATSLESFTQPQMHLFSGKLVVTLQAANQPGVVTLTVKDKTNRRIKPLTLSIPVRE